MRELPERASGQCATTECIVVRVYCVVRYPVLLYKLISFSRFLLSLSLSPQAPLSLHNSVNFHFRCSLVVCVVCVLGTGNYNNSTAAPGHSKTRDATNRSQLVLYVIVCVYPRFCRVHVQTSSTRPTCHSCVCVWCSCIIWHGDASTPILWEVLDSPSSLVTAFGKGIYIYCIY